MESEREKLRGKLEDMQTQCMGLKGELATQKVSVTVCTGGERYTQIMATVL